MFGDCEWCEMRAALVPVPSRNPAAPGGWEYLCSECACLVDAERARSFWRLSPGGVRHRRASVDGISLGHLVLLVAVSGQRRLSSAEQMVR
jgi:hypothetical protein